MKSIKQIAVIGAATLLPALAFAQGTSPAPATGTPAPAAAPTTPAAPAKGGHHHSGRLKAADTDHDGSLSKAEVDAAKLTGLSKNFAAIDTNNDGKLSRDELKAYRAAHKGTRKGAPGTTPAPTTPAPATPAAPAK